MTRQIARDGAPDVLLLMSGGVDSTACVAYYQDRGWPLSGLFLDYGQAAVEKERKAARNVASAVGIQLVEIDCTGVARIGAGEVVGRNGFLFMAALMWSDDGTSIVASGIHETPDYIDTNEVFLDHMQTVYDYYTGGTVRIDTPFLKSTKFDIYQYALSKDVPLSLTYSCEKGYSQPCGTCLSCCDLEELRAGT